MFAVSEVGSGGQQPSSLQMQILSAAAAMSAQRVAAMGQGERAADTGAQSSGQNSEAARMVRDSLSKRNQSEKAQADKQSVKDPQADSAVARSVVEAQEASEAQTKLTAAFQARYALTDLLSVIRDPEDRMLPSAPE